MMDAELPEVLAMAGARQGAPLRTLLYVEDNPANLKLIEQLVARRQDIRLLSAIDGHLGVQLAKAEQPDVILMDINLPGISGIEALRILRDDHVDRAHSRGGAQRECDAPGYRERSSGGILPVSDEADQGE